MASASPRLLASAALAFLLAALAGCSGPGTTPAPPGDFTCAVGTGVPFENVDRSFGFCLPARWGLQTNVYTTDVYLTSPIEGYDTFQENLNLIRERVAANMTLDSYVQAHIERIPGLVQNFTSAAPRVGALDGQESRLLEYNGVFAQLSNQTLHWQQTLAIHDGVAYLFTYTALEGTQGIFQAPVDSILASFRFL